MDICFRAFQGETTGKMVEDATSATPKTGIRGPGVLPRPPIAYGDFCLLPWAWLQTRTEAPRTTEKVHVAA